MAQDWTELEPSERRRRAEAACRQGDAEALWALTEAYLRFHRGPELSQHTRRPYRRGIELLLNYWSSETLLHPSHADAAGFVEELESSGAGRATINVHLAGIRALYRALYWADVVESAPFIGLRASSSRERATGGHETQVYSESERNLLLSGAAPVDQLMILLCTEAGLLVSEAIALRWTDIDLVAGHLVLRSSTGRAERVVQLTPSLVDALRALRRGKGDRVLGFTSDARARQRMMHLCKRVGVPYRGVSALRARVDAPGARAGGSITRPEEASDLPDVGNLRPEVHPVRGLPTYAAFREEITRADAEGHRTGNSFGVITIQLDPALENAEEHGRGLGEAVLSVLAARINRARRPYDFVAYCPVRTFCVLLKNLGSRARLRNIGRRFWRAIRSHPVHLQGNTFRVEVRIRGGLGPHEADLLMNAIGEPPTAQKE